MSDDKADKLRLAANESLRALIEEHATEAIRERLEIAEAQRYLLHDALAQLVAYVERLNGFMFADDQAVLRRARIALQEVQR